MLWSLALEYDFHVRTFHFFLFASGGGWIEVSLALMMMCCFCPVTVFFIFISPFFDYWFVGLLVGSLGSSILFFSDLTSPGIGKFGSFLAQNLFSFDGIFF